MKKLLLLAALSGGALASAPAWVPEPAVWGMILGGLGLLGAANRHRRSATVFA